MEAFFREFDDVFFDVLGRINVIVYDVDIGDVILTYVRLYRLL